MPRTFEVAVTSPHSTRQVFDAFAATTYWHDRYAAFGSSMTLDELDRTSTPDGESVRLVMTEDLRADRLPSVIARVYPGELKVRTTEHWQVGGDDRVHGTIEITVLGAPGSGRGHARIEPASGGSRMVVDGTVEVRLPLVGGRVESAIGAEFRRLIPDVGRFTTEWIDNHD
ncbi:DUF2505 domain-containing protein [Gordonia oryzae]|uniref:DUF2505 domain-containing protein n=1 Tax=Gordonia oryzae TaxID=2487349 RepID=A0A3N4GZZ5_9ACTN|nr:DUF2505 domain-containing protein [Gordonia oryzae]RPA66296.1 DUF2505 domain-containing protein [Gordonia oryzae]